MTVCFWGLTSANLSMPSSKPPTWIFFRHSFTWWEMVPRLSVVSTSERYKGLQFLQLCLLFWKSADIGGPQESCSDGCRGLAGSNSGEGRAWAPRRSGGCEDGSTHILAGKEDAWLSFLGRTSKKWFLVWRQAHSMEVHKSRTVLLLWSKSVESIQISSTRLSQIPWIPKVARHFVLNKKM